MEALGIFRELESAGRAVDRLVQEGFSEGQITSLTSIPYPDGVLVKTEQRSWLRWFTLAGGILGACLGLLLAAGTAWVYPVQTGDKPIVALYPTGIITYELMMLFFLVSTMVGLFLEMGLPPWRKRLYDPEIGEGSIGISVVINQNKGESGVGAIGTSQEVDQVTSLPADRQRTRAEEILLEAGAVRVITEDKP